MKFRIQLTLLLTSLSLAKISRSKPSARPRVVPKQCCKKQLNIAKQLTIAFNR